MANLAKYFVSGMAFAAVALILATSILGGI